MTDSNPHLRYTQNTQFTKMTHFSNAFTDVEGYDELKKHMRTTHEFSKDMLSILQERAEIEAAYARGLAKIALKSNKTAAKDSVGSLMSAWNAVCSHLTAEADAHKVFSEMLNEDVHKPMKITVDQQVKNRKTVEVTVDKAMRVLHDKKNDLLKSKRITHTKAKDSEHMAVQLEDPSQRGKILSDKEVSKLQLKTKRAEEAAVRADADYLDLIKNCERARHEMERTLVRAVLAMESQELERITEQKEYLKKYSEGLVQMEPTLHNCVDELSRAVLCVSADGDIVAIANSKGKEAKPHEQLLYDTYEEDMGNTMSVERRRQLLDRKVHILDTEIQKEQRAREGIARLCGVYNDQPGFADESAKQDVSQQLNHSNDMLNVLRASRFKIMAAKAFLDKVEKPEDDISNYIQIDKTKQSGGVAGWRSLTLGSRNSTLRIPKNAPPLSPLVESMGGRGTGDGAHSGGDMTNSTTRERRRSERLSAEDRRNQRMTSIDSFQSDISFDDDRDPVDLGNDANDEGAFYSAIDEDFNVAARDNSNVDQSSETTSVDTVIGQCRVIYDYIGQETEELSINAGDVINIYHKDDDGWWRGELNGVVGLFPGSYVEEEEQSENGTDL